MLDRECTHDELETAYELQFLGGPLDGHRQLFFLPFPLSVCFRSNTILKNTPWLRRLARVLAGKNADLFHVAIYNLEVIDGTLTLCHKGSRIAAEQRHDAETIWLVAEDIIN